ncbi:hypothetical protein Fcan01_19800 [Folsomia candida]|uniref:Uncharacterized protein n=1 Tax=Folsomia candida TaxID=158441 RepID=A0A226DJ79_FOLCA|nr:hypothetical protein Fcan01_19800 [Folsomia candida]
MVTTKLDPALIPRAKEILQKLGHDDKFKWNDKLEIVYDGTVWTASNLANLLKYFILQSQMFDKLEFSKDFIALILHAGIIPSALQQDILGGDNESKCAQAVIQSDPEQQLGGGTVIEEETKEAKQIEFPSSSSPKPLPPLTEEQRKKTLPSKGSKNKISGVCKWISFEDRFVLK